MRKFFLVMALGFVFATGFGLTAVSLTQPAMADGGVAAAATERLLT
jgi:hypothetical protein